MKKTIQLFCLLLALIFMDACDSEKEITPPHTVLSADSMVMVMADVHLAEARLLNAGYHADQPGLKSDIMQATLLTDGSLKGKDLKGMADEFKKKLGSGVVALIGVEEGKASAVVGVTEDRKSTRLNSSHRT